MAKRKMNGWAIAGGVLVVVLVVGGIGWAWNKWGVQFWPTDKTAK